MIDARNNDDWQFSMSRIALNRIRGHILLLLTASERLSYSRIKEKLEGALGAVINPGTLTHHLKVLEDTGLLSKQKIEVSGKASEYSFYAITDNGRKAHELASRSHLIEDYDKLKPMAEAEPIRIGLLHSLVGTMSMSEEPLVQAATMAIAEINQKGGVLGRKIVPIIEDGSSDPETFARKARKLIDDDKVCSVFGCWTSASRKAVLEVVEDRENLLWYPVQYEGYERSKNCIYTGATVNQQILPAIDWCLETQGWRRFFLVGSDYVFPRMANMIIRLHLRKRGDVVGEKYVNLGDWNFKSVLETIKRSKPDVVLNTVNGDSNIAFFRQLHEEKIGPDKVPVFSFSIAEVELRHIGTQFTAGHYCGWNYFQSIDTPENRRFVRAFKRRYGLERVTDDPIEAAYFQVHLFAEAVRKAHSTNVGAIRTAALGLEYGGPGGLVRIDRENQHIWSEARIGRIRTDGQFDIIWKSESLIRPDPFPYRDKRLNRLLSSRKRKEI